MITRMRPRVTRVFLCLCWIFASFLSMWGSFKHEQPSFLSAPTNTRPLLLSLPLSHSLPLFLRLPQTHTRRTMHTFAQHRHSPSLSHNCTPPLICAAVNVCAISKVLNQLWDAEPVNGLGGCRALQSLCSHIFWTHWCTGRVHTCTHTHHSLWAHKQMQLEHRAARTSTVLCHPCAAYKGTRDGGTKGWGRCIGTSCSSEKRNTSALAKDLLCKVSYTNPFSPPITVRPQTHFTRHLLNSLCKSQNNEEMCCRSFEHSWGTAPPVLIKVTTYLDLPLCGITADIKRNPICLFG